MIHDRIRFNPLNNLQYDFNFQNNGQHQQILSFMHTPDFIKRRKKKKKKPLLYSIQVPQLPTKQPIKNKSAVKAQAAFNSLCNM